MIKKNIYWSYIYIYIYLKKLIYIEGYYAFSLDILKNIKEMFIYIYMSYAFYKPKE